MLHPKHPQEPRKHKPITHNSHPNPLMTMYSLRALSLRIAWTIFEMAGRGLAVN